MDVVDAAAVAAEQFVQGRQRGRQLRAEHNLGVPDGYERVRAARVGGIAETQALGQAQGVRVHLPAGGGMGFRRLAENLAVARNRALHLAFCPGSAGLFDSALPGGVVPALHAGVESGIAHAAQDVRTAAADVRARQQGAMQEPGQAMATQGRCAAAGCREQRFPACVRCGRGRD